MSMLDEITSRLSVRGVGVMNVNLFLGSSAVIPSGDGPYLSIHESGGTAPMATQNNTATARPTLQLLVRGASYMAARAMLAGAYEALGGANGLHGITIGGTEYIFIRPRQEITDVGRDAAGRATLSVNFEIEKKPS